jgi:hypothetical protein
VHGVHHDAAGAIHEQQTKICTRTKQKLEAFSRRFNLFISADSGAQSVISHLLMSSDASTNAISSWPNPTTNLPAGVPVCAS